MDLSIPNVVLITWCSVFTLSGTLHVVGYCFIILRARLDSTLHWLLCNVAINEVMRALVALCFAKVCWESHGAVGDAMRMRPAGQTRRNLSSGTFPNQWKILTNKQLELKEIPDSLLIILLASLFTTFLFEILAILQRYYSMGWREWRRAEVFNKRHTLLTISLWLLSGLFGAAFVILRHEQGETVAGLRNFWRIYWIAQSILVSTALIILVPIGVRLIYFRWRGSLPSTETEFLRNRSPNKHHNDLITPMDSLDLRHIAPSWKTDVYMVVLSGTGAIHYLAFAGSRVFLELQKPRNLGYGSKDTVWPVRTVNPFTGVGDHFQYSAASTGLFIALNIFNTVAITVNMFLLFLEDSYFQYEIKKIQANMKKWRSGNCPTPIEL